MQSCYKPPKLLLQHYKPFLFCHPYNTPTLKTKALYLVSGVQQTKWHFWMANAFIYREFMARFVTKATPSKKIDGRCCMYKPESNKIYMSSYW